MVTSKSDNQIVAIQKMNSVRSRKANGSNSSALRLLESDNQESSSSVSRNSVYKLKIDLMFDDTSRSTRSHRLDDPHGSHRTRSIIMYGRSELASTANDSSRSITSYLHESNETAKILADNAKKDVQRISNSVQAQIEQLFTDVAKDATSSFAVTCLGSLPLKDKVTSLQGLQEPLRELYLKEIKDEKRNTGSLDICATGLRVKISTKSENTTKSTNEGEITPFHNIAVWSAVKFTVSQEDGGAAFLPLITSPENIDKSLLFQPLSVSEQKRLANNQHAPIFAVVMRSADLPKVLECHAFICKSTEDAIVIAATLYQSLMAHVSSNSHRSTKRRTPRNQNGVSCISIASSSAVTGSNYHSRSQLVSAGRKSSFRSTNGSLGNVPSVASRSSRKKRVANSSLSSSSNIINEAVETSTEERKRKSHKSKRAPPIPTTIPGEMSRRLHSSNRDNRNSPSSSYHENMDKNGKHLNVGHTRKISGDAVYKASQFLSNGAPPAVVAAAIASSGGGLRTSDTTGDILTRVAIPRSGSFLNTGGLTRYKSRAARRNSDKIGNGGGGGGGGSPLGFSELFNEFRLHENLHSLDDILNAIIDADGMSFNDLKPIYKEFLLKLAVTLTKDELFQRSKNIMRRQKKKKLKRKLYTNSSQKKTKTPIFGTKSLKKVFQLGQFRSCRGKPPKPPRNKELGNHHRKSDPPIVIGPPTMISTHPNHGRSNPVHPHNQRNRATTSGSDVSLVRHENAFGLNRNSSSGYVSCSECSYDSESCTCTSADRCYCSLRTEEINENELRRRNERRSSKRIVQNANMNRQSLISCKSDDKCYCSLVEEDNQVTAAEDDSPHTHSDTTWCDTDSCISASKCYCKRIEHNGPGPRPMDANHKSKPHKSRRSRSTTRKPNDKFGVDYELFNINSNGNTKPVQSHEALSVKKSVEAAAIFADVKLSQTTDIKSLCANASNRSGSCRSYSVASRKQSHSYRKRESFSIGRRNEMNAVPPLQSLSSSSSQKSCSADDLLKQLSYIEKNIARAASVHSGKSKTRDIILRENFQNNYQSMRAVSASLEDTLGYLP
uniref:PID domain-containing protein n=1 Tax=Musca domestica TaxID=7370 RepID=A0A1I8MDX8_MUSDO